MKKLDLIMSPSCLKTSFCLTMLAAFLVSSCSGKPTPKDPEDSVNETLQDSVAVSKEMTYFPAIDRYLTDSVGAFYAPGKYCVPMHTIISVNESNSEDILVWGDFWVFLYNQDGDTLKTVSGGNHAGLMHVRETDYGYEVVKFERVEDGSSSLPSAKRIFGDKFDAYQACCSDADKREALRASVLADYVEKHDIPASFYQDYGWPAKQIK